MLSGVPLHTVAQPVPHEGTAQKLSLNAYGFHPQNQRTESYCSAQCTVPQEGNP